MGTTGCVRPTGGAPGGHTADVSTGGGGRIERQTAGTLPVRPLRSIDPTHGRRVLTKIWDKRGEEDELQQVDIKGTIYVNPNKRDTSSLPYVVRYDDTDESNEEIDLDCLGKD
eukprot:5238723-Pyramimonas_sp.AAC.1